MSYASPSNFELFKSLIHKEIEHQSPNIWRRKNWL